MTQPRSHHDDEWYDEVRITTVPRYKTSSLSGDEWRTSARIQILRKTASAPWSRIQYPVLSYPLRR